MKRYLVLLACVSAAAGSAYAREHVKSGPDRGGFTLLLTMGLGLQNDTGVQESAIGLGGLNLGIGGFLSNDLALMFRFSGTNVSYSFDESGIEFGYNQVSGVGGVALQYWLNDRFNVEGGPGYGFWSTDSGDDTGFGLMVGAGFTVFNRGRNNLQLGLEYAPAFTTGGAIHNVGLTLGHQLL